MAVHHSRNFTSTSGNETNKNLTNTEISRASQQDRNPYAVKSGGGGGKDAKISDVFKAPPKKAPNDFFGRWAAEWDNAEGNPCFQEENLF